MHVIYHAINKKWYNINMVDTTYEDDIKIDVNRLDYEWDRQPALMMKWSQKHAQSVKRLHQAKQNISIVRAEAKRCIEQLRSEIDLDIRTYPEDYHLPENPSEKAIEAAINRDKEFIKVCNEQQKLIKEASDNLIQAIEEEAVYAAAERGMMARRKSLENLAELFRANYYSEPRQPSLDKRLERAIKAGGDFREYLNRHKDGGQ